MRLPTARQAFAATAATTVLLLTAACGSDAEQSASPSSTSAPADAGSDSADSGDYADGTYEAEGSYANPGGTSSVTVSLTLADNEITKVDVQPGASGTSLQYQRQFISGIADQVVGKSIDDIDVSKVSGSSLTSGGFNQAVDKIKAEASQS